MPRSQSLRIADIRNVLSLVGDVYQLHDDRHAMRLKLMRGLQRLLRAEKATLPEIVDFRLGGSYQIASSIVHGFSNEELAYVAAYSQHDSAGDPAFEPIASGGPGQFGVRREDIMTVRAWRNTKHASAYAKGANTGPFLYAGYLVPPDRVVGIGLHRAWNDRPFTERDRNIADLLLQHFGPTLFAPPEEATPPARFRFGRPTTFPGSVPGPPEKATLPARVRGLSEQRRRVLVHLLDGSSEKQVARKMDLSHHTIHEYVKYLYRYFEVRSRPELLSLFVSVNDTSRERAAVWRALLREDGFRRVKIARRGGRRA